jgi:hypothetical protein
MVQLYTLSLFTTLYIITHEKNYTYFVYVRVHAVDNGDNNNKKWRKNLIDQLHSALLRAPKIAHKQWICRASGNNLLNN